MIDIHTHLLPQVDDGSTDWEETLQMVRQGIRDGIEGAVCTPHAVNVLDESFESRIQFKFQQLQERIGREGLKLQLWLGAEIHCQTRFSTASSLATLNHNGKYLLIELPLGELPVDVGEKLFALTLDGVVPILAHPERNTVIVRKPDVAFQFVQQGALVQLNAGSLTGDFGRSVKRTAFTLMDHGLVHFVASDCHGARTRSMALSRSYRLVAEKWGTEKAEALFRIHPRKAVWGESIEVPEPTPITEKKRFGFKRFGI
jgi:protein-tyrosine phosphatase